MADPFTALVYAVQVMNFLKTLILRTLQERKDSVVESSPRFYLEPSDDNGHQSIVESCQQDTAAENEQQQQQKPFPTTENEEAQENLVSKETVLECSPESLQNNSSAGGESSSLISTSENLVCNGDLYCEFPRKGNIRKSKTGQSSCSNATKGTKKTRSQQHVIHGTLLVGKRGTRTLNRVDSKSERIEAWR